MTVPKAVASSVKTPGFWLTVNLLGAAAGPGSAALQAIILAPIDSDGNLTPNTEFRQLNGPDDAKTAFGKAGQGHLTAKRLFQMYGLANVVGAGVSPSGGAVASGTLTATGPATGNTTYVIDVCGRQIEVPWNNGETADQFKTTAISYINQLSEDIPVVASSGGVGIVTLTANYAGPWGNDITFGATLKAGSSAFGTSIVASGSGKLSGGTTEPSYTTVLANMATTERRIILPCLSNAVVEAATGAAEDVEQHIKTYGSGLDALLQIGVLGHSGTQANAKTGAASRNFEAMQYIHCLNGQSLPCEFAGAEVGDQLKWHQLRANYNRIGNPFLGLFGAKDKVGDKPTQAEVEDLLRNGVTPVSYARDGSLFVVRPITTHFQDTSGAPDFRAYDMSDIHGAYSVAEDLRTAIPQEFKNASISPDLPAAADPLPPGVVELRDVKSFVTSRLFTQARLGVVDRTRLQTALDNGELIVEIDTGDPTQVNIFIPYKIIPPLAKIGVVMSRAA